MINSDFSCKHVHLYTPITAVTCESQGCNSFQLPILPGESRGFDLFSLHDPFGLRKAIAPVLLVDADGITRRMGTAFHGSVLDSVQKDGVRG